MRNLAFLALGLSVLLAGVPVQAKTPDTCKPDAACCEACPRSYGSFEAEFPGKCSYLAVKPGISKYVYQDKADKAIYGIAVFSGTERRHLGDLKTYLVKQGIKALDDVSHRDVSVGAAKGVEFQGIDNNGTPMTVRLYVTNAHSYVVAASGFDMAKNREFVESFKLSPEKPAKPAKPAKK